jgi:phospholipid-translocating ATPase
MKTVEEDVRQLLSTVSNYSIKKFFGNNYKNKNLSEDEVREIYFNQPLPDHMIDPKTNQNKIIYQRNKIRTTKYTPLNFIPKNLFFQFTNIANSYFLFIIILGCFQIFGVQSPGMQAVPLIVIVVLTAIKDAFEDYRRAISDYELNSSKVHKLEGISNFNALQDQVGPWRKFKKGCTKIFSNFSQLFKRKSKIESNDLENNPNLDLFTLRSNNLNNINMIEDTMSNNTTTSNFPVKFKTTQWKNVLVGDILRIKKNEEIPSDVLILKSSNENNVCYVETKNLDGETNLKTKQALQFSSKKIRELSDLTKLKFSVSTEQPNKDLYTFHGVVHDECNDNVKEPISETVTINNVLLRGSVLRNTNYVICIVISTGADTKIMLNSGVTPTKKSRISRDLNYFVLINFLLLFILCFVSGLINGLFYRKTDNSRLFFEYKPYAPTPAANGTLTFFVVLIMYQTLVPISLYITIEIIKTIQVYFIYSDVNMYYEKLDFPCIPKSWGISDDLGQIEYIFSDKTGTLTQNIMEFKKCAITDKSYGLAYTSAQQGWDIRVGNVDVHEKSMKMNELISIEFSAMCEKMEPYNPFFKKENVTFVSKDFVDELSDSNNKEFLYALAICHSAVIEYDSIEDIADSFAINYSAESPDEVALVSFARDMGVVFLGEENDEYSIYENGEESKYKVLCVIPFTSARKRMSIVVQNPDDRIILYMKGADNVILERSIEGKYDTEIRANLEEYSVEGLRTLCVSSKELNHVAFYNWFNKYLEASKLLDEQREIQMEQLADEFERGVRLIGATAIDDKLQDDVPHTIESLRKAGIKVWVLTGDKVETAISIGYSCSMLNNNMDLLKIQSNNVEELEKLIDFYLREKFNVNDLDDPNVLMKAKLDHSIPDENHALLVDGKTLSLLFDESPRNIQLKFLLLGKRCCSVLCCRVSPSQKADVVKLVKENLDVITLAIGDGANDVSMIQAANVGVGIAGEEGRQAAMSSDYAIGQFSYLERLLLVHGKWSYQRLSEMIPCFFYKNVIFVMPLFWYGIFTDFDGTYLYEYTFLMLFNLFFTSVPVITLATMDQDVPDYVSLAIPQLYRPGIQRSKYTDVWKFLIYMIDGFYQSAISFFFPWLIFRTGNVATHNGLSISTVFSVGTFSVNISIFACNLYIILKQRRWDLITISLNVLSDVLLVIWVCAWSSSPFSNNFYQLGIRVYQSGIFWACLFIGILACVIPGFTYNITKANFFPNDVDKVRNILNIGFFENRNKTQIQKDLEIAHKISGLSENDEITNNNNPADLEKTESDSLFKIGDPAKAIDSNSLV